MSGPLILDGKIAAGAVKDRLRTAIAKLREHNVQPGLAAVLIGDNPASATYVRNKIKACEEIGIFSTVVRRESSCTQTDLLAIVAHLNADPAIHGILVQSPLPSHIDELAITLALDPAKDVDGFHPYNVGMLLLGRPVFESCTPAGVIELLRQNNISPAGKRVVIIGRSTIVGKPLAAMLLLRGEWGDATVTVAHSKTPSLSELTRQADILIAAIGSPKLVTGDMVKAGGVVIDVGINRMVTDDGKTKLVGDVDFDDCLARVSAITPVPGGVGPMTIAMLLKNTVHSALLRSGLHQAIRLS